MVTPHGNAVVLKPLHTGDNRRLLHLERLHLDQPLLNPLNQAKRPAALMVLPLTNEPTHPGLDIL
jgi:hypothetical protein